MSTLDDRTAEFSEAMWELEAAFGLGLTVPEQVSIARDLGTLDGAVTPSVVAAAFKSRGLKPPPKRYAEALVSRVHAIVPQRSR